MSEYIFVTNIFEYSNIRIYSSHSGTHRMSNLHPNNKCWKKYVDVRPFCNCSKMIKFCLPSPFFASRFYVGSVTEQIFCHRAANTEFFLGFSSHFSCCAVSLRFIWFSKLPTICPRWQGHAFAYQVGWSSAFISVLSFIVWHVWCSCPVLPWWLD